MPRSFRFWKAVTFQYKRATSDNEMQWLRSIVRVLVLLSQDLASGLFYESYDIHGRKQCVAKEIRWAFDSRQGDIFRIKP